MTTKLRAAVLVSGSGTNLQALLDACATPGFPAEIAVVVSNVAAAFALERARKANVATVVLDHKQFGAREEYDRAMVEALRSHQVELVCLAGFMRLLTPLFLGAYPSRVINIHPALLPAFPGMHGVKQAFEYGAKITGCTVHLVDEGTDTGPVIAQSAVPVLPDDTEQSLAERIHREEHALYPAVLRMFGERKVRVSGRRVEITAAPSALWLRNPAGTP